MSLVFSDAIFWIALVMCTVAQLFIVRAVFAKAPVAPEGSPAAEGRAAGRLKTPSRPLEIAWVVLPAIALALVFAWAWELQHPSLGRMSWPPMTGQVAVVHSAPATGER